MVLARAQGAGHRPHSSLGAYRRNADRVARLGQLRVVEIARALYMEPVMMLLDEQAARLRHQEQQPLALLRSLAAEGVTILIAEHDMLS